MVIPTLFFQLGKKGVHSLVHSMSVGAAALLG
jgi:hypothetical protein